jgi:hypothetical protein
MRVKKYIFREIMRSEKESITAAMLACES